MASLSVPSTPNSSKKDKKPFGLSGSVEAAPDFTLEDIAEHAGISRATVYRYFSNVDLLYWKLL